MFFYILLYYKKYEEKKSNIIIKKLYIFKLFNPYIDELNKWTEFKVLYKNNLLILNLFLIFLLLFLTIFFFLHFPQNFL